MSVRKPWIRLTAFGWTATLLVLTTGSFPVAKVSAVELPTRALKMSNDLSGQTSRYEIRLSGQSAGTVGSIRLQICANDPFIGNACTPPAGLNLLSGSLIAQTGMTGFNIHPSSIANQLILTRAPAASVAGLATYTMDGVINPTSAGTFYGRLETFASTDASGPNTDFGGLAIAILNSAVSVRSTVPPYLLFCIANTIQPYDCSTANGNYVDFGEFSPTKTSFGKTQALAATNAEFGYTIRVLGTTLTSGINVIPPLSSGDVSRVGVSQFGINLRANSTPSAGSDAVGSGTGTPTAGYNSANFYRFVPGDIIASNTAPDEYRLYTVSYIANVSSTQAAGIYVSTLMFVALASF